MRLVSFSIGNYRSISQAKNLKLAPMTALVGPNNEGKSNILRALVIALGLLEAVKRTRISRGRVAYQRAVVDRYNWESDFPLALQDKTPEGQSRFDLEFSLNNKELDEFSNEVGSKLNGNLPIRLELGRGIASFSVRKPGKGKAALTEKRDRIVRFLSKRISLTYIPSIRTAREAEQIVDQLLGQALEVLETNPEYKAALQAIAKLQQPILDGVSGEISKTLKMFIKGVKQVELQISEGDRSQALRIGTQIIVNDGTPTLLERKGDGVQSLAALALMRHLSESGSLSQHLILAIEEPETHLHPDAIQELKRVLTEIAKRNQVIITTHNPLLVNRSNIESNILVQKSRAKAARHIAEIRDALGVRASDNLRHAELILLVEGEADRKSLTFILPSVRPDLKSAIEDGTLALDSLIGGSNLAYKVSAARATLCNVHCFLDNDQCGTDAAEKAQNEGLIDVADTHFAICDGRDESELEDLYDPVIYESMLQNRFGVSVNHPRFKGRKKWSHRLAAVFKTQGKLWNAKTEQQVKSLVADLVASQPERAIQQHHRTIVEALADALSAKLDALNATRAES